MKSMEKHRAVIMRRRGITQKEIAKRLGVSRGSVLRWVSGIINDKIRAIKNNNAKGTKIRAEAKRIMWRSDGRAYAKRLNPLHIKGCMLYWAEGAKERCAVIFSNSDINMVKLFLSFLRKFFPIEAKKVKLSLYFYLGNGKTKREIVDYWFSNLGINRNMVGQIYVKHAPKIYGKRGKLDFGTCRLYFSSVRVINHLYGAICEYGKFHSKNNETL